MQSATILLTFAINQLSLEYLPMSQPFAHNVDLPHVEAHLHAKWQCATDGWQFALCQACDRD